MPADKELREIRKMIGDMEDTNKIMQAIEALLDSAPSGLQARDANGNTRDLTQREAIEQYKMYVKLHTHNTGGPYLYSSGERVIVKGE